MWMLRNPEAKKNRAVFAILWLGAVIGCVFLGKIEYVPIVSGVFAICFGAEAVLSAGRYKKVRLLAENLDNLINQNLNINFDEFGEGEMSVLKNQLDKVVLILKGQRESLQKEKLFLTDSIADISHQLRTPLTSINLIIDFLRQENLPEEKRYRLAADLQKLSDRIEWLVDSLLKISKIDSGTVEFKKDKIHITQLVAKRAGPLAIAMDIKNQSLETDCRQEHFFTGDMSWSAEALGNILKNCSEHTPYGGKIRIVSSQTPVFTQLEISDTGPGFTEEDLPNIFTRFYKGQNSSEQSIGIGLALSKMIIMEQNGTIKAENRGGGAKFTIKFYHSVV